MKAITNSFLLILATLFISCGDNTQTPIITDVSNIQIDEPRDPILYSTDDFITLSATVTYKDASDDDATKGINWKSSHYQIASIKKGIASSGTENGGDTNITISHYDLNDYVTLHVVKLTHFDITHSDINSTGTYPLEAKGSFEDGTTDKVILKNIFWSADNGAEIIIEDNLATITLLTGETNVTATLFRDINSSSPIAPQSKIYIID